MEGAHTLVVVRHARAEDYAAGGDFERELTARGRTDAAEAGRWLVAEGVRAGGALVSAAQRTRTTWDELAGAAGWDVEPTYDPLLYSTDEDGALDLVREMDEAVRTAVILGHNPTIGILAQMLDDGEGRVELSNQLLGYPTCGVAVFDVPTTWADLAPSGARLRAFHVGRG